MLDKNFVEECIAESKKTLQDQFGVEKIGYFGSYARNEQKQSSDIDILIELEKPIGLEFLDIKYYLEDKLGIAVDLVTINALKPQMKDQILKEVIYQ
ncbi:nucleotidyltransferase family protein [Lentibacillus sp. N15]|uniref:nucleotidyltransferase family protein n=1 Tax=Lentibacillus songyuanensis TaxID=3136161 RepID=UPI0031BA73E5